MDNIFKMNSGLRIEFDKIESSIPGKFVNFFTWKKFLQRGKFDANEGAASDFINAGPSQLCGNGDSVTKRSQTTILFNLVARLI